MFANWDLLHTLILTIIIVNELLAIFTVFREKRDIAATWAWLLVLFLIPIFGFIFYAFVGRKLPKQRLRRIQSETQQQLEAAFEKQGDYINSLPRFKEETMRMYRRTIMLFQSIDRSFLTLDNHLEEFIDGNDLFDRMFDDIAAAKNSVHVEFYSIYNDKIGNQLLTLLQQKAAEGVEVRVLYDSWGSMGVRSSFYDDLRDNGGQAASFLMARHDLFDFRLNYRLHRKIVVIDGHIGYIGGFNVGDQYLGRAKKFGNWRDTHLRVDGSFCYSMQERFIHDWNASVHNRNNKIRKYKPYFPPIKNKSGVPMQLVCSGPDDRLEKIKLGYMRMFNAAQDHIYIQSPYLIPDDSVLQTLKIAAHSGVDVRIMVPCMPDHPFVYRATQYYARDLADDGITIYFYNNGFMHAKTVCVDTKMASVGSANQDIRSYKLDFEAQSFIYDEEETDRLERIFIEDIRQCTVMTPQRFAAQPKWLHFKQTFSRLLSPLL